MLNSLLKIKHYRNNQDGVAAVEVAILFPVLMALLMVIFDIGQGIVINQKTVTASQVIGDLITRNETVDEDIIDDVINAGELSIRPFSLENFGYDIISVEFDEDENPFVLWRTSTNVEEDDGVLEDTIGLGDAGEGVLVVTVVNRYEPFFSNLVTGAIEMKEVSFLRGRKSATVTCSDCD